MSMDLKAKFKKYRIQESEYQRMKSLLGREPEGLEWALFSALWSEHCSYKSSKVHLRKFAQKSTRVLQSMGENAGVIDLGLGEKIAFKMESHNHPSFIEPYQGAATGVGGILRDIFTMGARPIALGNYLCFGDPKAPRMSQLVDGVVRGIAGYGNCVGVPTVTGQTEFDKSYNDNILVNAFALGLFQGGDPVVTSPARGVGNWVVYVGAKTGRDGVHGASMASESFAEDSASQRPTVQIGDPFYEKLLIESCIEVMKRELVVAIQDMGAAGLTSSSFEMAAKGGVGLRLDLDQVPVRDSTIGPEEILLSESQERMLLICTPENFKAVQAVFTHWGLDASRLGEVIKGPKIELFWRGECVCKIDPKILVEEAPVYERPYSPWKSPRQVEKLTASTPPPGLVEKLECLSGCSREWIYQQYDQRVGAATVHDASESVAVMRLPSGRGLGIVLGCRPQLMKLDARLGGADAGFYPSFELAAKGFRPLAMTDCLNFGNPEKPEIMSEFVASVEALAEACRDMEAPVISGNVSLYNETMGRNITSTPATGVVGLREELSGIPVAHFTQENQEVVLCRFDHVTLSPEAFAGKLNFKLLAQQMEELRLTVLKGGITAARVVNLQGLDYALARMALKGVGAEINTSSLGNDWNRPRLYEVLLVGAPGLSDRLKKEMPSGKVHKIGVSRGQELVLNQERQGVDELYRRYKSGWARHFPQLA